MVDVKGSGYFDKDSGFRQILIDELRAAVNDLISLTSVLDTAIPSSSQRCILVCICIERCLSHGLKPGGILTSERQLFEVIQQATSQAKNSLWLSHDLKVVERLSLTTKGKARAWIRQCLNQRHLDDNIVSIAKRSKLVTYCFEPYAIFNVDHSIKQVAQICKKLKDIKFNLTVDDSNLNMDSFWETAPDVYRATNKLLPASAKRRKEKKGKRKKKKDRSFKPGSKRRSIRSELLEGKAEDEYFDGYSESDSSSSRSIPGASAADPRPHSLTQSAPIAVPKSPKSSQKGLMNVGSAPLAGTRVLEDGPNLNLASSLKEIEDLREKLKLAETKLKREQSRKGPDLGREDTSTVGSAPASAPSSRRKSSRSRRSSRRSSKSKISKQRTVAPTATSTSTSTSQPTQSVGSEVQRTNPTSSSKPPLIPQDIPVSSSIKYLRKGSSPAPIPPAIRTRINARLPQIDLNPDSAPSNGYSNPFVPASPSDVQFRDRPHFQMNAPSEEDKVINEELEHHPAGLSMFPEPSHDDYDEDRDSDIESDHDSDERGSVSSARESSEYGSDSVPRDAVSPVAGDAEIRVKENHIALDHEDDDLPPLEKDEDKEDYVVLPHLERNYDDHPNSSVETPPNSKYPFEEREYDVIRISSFGIDTRRTIRLTAHGIQHLGSGSFYPYKDIQLVHNPKFDRLTVVYANKKEITYRTLSASEITHTLAERLRKQETSSVNSAAPSARESIDVDERDATMYSERDASIVSTPTSSSETLRAANFPDSIAQVNPSARHHPSMKNYRPYLSSIAAEYEVDVFPGAPNEPEAKADSLHGQDLQPVTTGSLGRPSVDLSKDDLSDLGSVVGSDGELQHYLISSYFQPENKLRDSEKQRFEVLMRERIRREVQRLRNRDRARRREKPTVRQTIDLDLADKTKNRSQLDIQGKQCYSCGHHIAARGGGARYCEYTGKMYCSRCHYGESTYIPAKVVHKLDIGKYPVCKSACKYLDRIYEMPEVPRSMIKSSLYFASKPMQQFAHLQLQLSLIAGYIEKCPQQMDLLDLLGTRQYLLYEGDLLSVRDLVEILGENHYLLKELTSTVKLYERHIAHECDVCGKHGALCEYCKDPKPMFNFQIPYVLQCVGCNTLYHTKCYEQMTCPECSRLGKKSKRKKYLLETESSSRSLASNSVEDSQDVARLSEVLQRRQNQQI